MMGTGLERKRKDGPQKKNSGVRAKDFGYRQWSETLGLNDQKIYNNNLERSGGMLETRAGSRRSERKKLRGTQRRSLLKRELRKEGVCVAA